MDLKDYEILKKNVFSKWELTFSLRFQQTASNIKLKNEKFTVWMR